MNAHELTVVVNDLKDRTYEIEKQVSYLTQESKKLRQLLSDLQIDVKMLGR